MQYYFVKNQELSKIGNLLEFKEKRTGFIILSMILRKVINIQRIISLIETYLLKSSSHMIQFWLKTIFMRFPCKARYELYKDASYCFWTNPGSNIQQNSSCAATYFPSHKLSKKDE